MKTLIFICLILTSPIFARGGALINSLPTNWIFPIPGPILFPGYVTAAGNNPAALGTFGKEAAIQGSYTPSYGSSSAKEYFGGLAVSSQKMGVGAGFIGDDYGGTMVSNAYTGVGFMIDPIALGIGLRKFNLSGGSSPSVDLGLIAGEGASKGNGLRFGFVAYNLTNSAALDIAVGFGGGKKYNMELDVLLPSTGSGNQTIITIAANIFAGEAVGIGFGTSYNQTYSSYMHRLGLTVSPWDKVSIFAQYTTAGNHYTAGNVWTGGLMVEF